jgi:hypothetical protein
LDEGLLSTFEDFLRVGTVRNYFKALRSSPGFHVDQPPNDDNYTAEIFATVRDNGRILDYFKCVVDGTDILEAGDFCLSKLFNDSVVKTHTLRMQRWPRDLHRSP